MACQQTPAITQTFRPWPRGPIVRRVRAFALGCLAILLASIPSPPACAQSATPPQLTAPGPAPTPSAQVPFDFRPYNFFLGAIDASVLLLADSLCPANSATICPFGNGGGIFVAYGRRYARSHEIVVGYDLTVRDARQLFSSATLQQIRAEHRWVWSSPRTNFEGIVGVGGGAVIYGERFGISAGGLVLTGSIGGNYHLSPFVSLGLLLRLDALRFFPFTTDDGVLRGQGGIATITAAAYLTVTFLGHN